MRKTALSTAFFGTMLAVALSTAPAHAQATRTWVSGVGDDANPCSRTAPCKTYAGAISKTAAGGEISTLDPGGFGAVTITKAITISGDGTLAGILNAGTNGVIINAGANDKIILRNLSINGANTGLAGIRYIAGGQVVVDRVTISGVTSHAIDVSLTNTGKLYVRDSHITKALNGIRLATTAGFLTASIDNVRVDNVTTNGIDVASGNVFATVTRSIIVSAPGAAVITSVGAGTINIDGSALTNNGTAVSSAAAGSTIRISNNVIYNNTTGLNVGGGTIATSGNNRTGGNATPGATNGTITQQ